MNHYVYKLTALDGAFYYGSRSSTKEPDADRYMGSGVWPVQCRRNGVLLNKTIVASGFATRAGASEHEVAMIMVNQDDPLCMNLSTTVQVPFMGQRQYVNLWSIFLKSGITACGSLAACLYIEVIGLGRDKGVSNYVLAKRARREIQECDDALSLIASLGQTCIPQIEKNGNVWKIKSI